MAWVGAIIRSWVWCQQGLWWETNENAHARAVLRFWIIIEGTYKIHACESKYPAIFNSLLLQIGHYRILQPKHRIHLYYVELAKNIQLKRTENEITLLRIGKARLSAQQTVQTPYAQGISPITQKKFLKNFHHIKQRHFTHRLGFSRKILCSRIHTATNHNKWIYCWEHTRFLFIKGRSLQTR